MSLDITTAKKISTKIKEELKNQIFSGNKITEDFAVEIVKFIDSENLLSNRQLEKAAQFIFLNNCRIKTYRRYYEDFVSAVERALDDSFEEFLINIIIQID